MGDEMNAVRFRANGRKIFLLTALALVIGGPAATATPPPCPTCEFDTAAQSPQAIRIDGDPADANIAVSRTHVCLTARDAIACYTKGGRLVALGPAATFQARPYLAQDFFQTTSSAISLGPTPNGTVAKDGRIVFDQLRKRFLVAFQTREEHPHLLIAASKSEDPRDGWFVYEDLVEKSAATTPFTSSNNWGQDYMWMGINGSFLFISNDMSTCTGVYGVNRTCQFFHTRHLSYALDDLIDGVGVIRREWIDPAADSAAPCVDDSSSAHAFWVHRDSHNHVTVWGRAGSSGTPSRIGVSLLSSDDPPNGVQAGGSPLDYGNIIGSSPTNAECRGDRLVFVTNDGHRWGGQTKDSAVVRLVSLDVKHFFDQNPSITKVHDRLFGRASPGDPPGFIADYGWPAVSTNANGDIVVGSVRTNPTIFPELRASVWSAGQPDISGSTLLKSGLGPLGEYHMAGAAADPSTQGVYLAQAWGSDTGPWRMRVSKMLGTVMPDLIAVATTPQALDIAAGASSVVEIDVLNQGDGAIGATTGFVMLSSSNTITISGGPVIGQFTVPPLFRDGFNAVKVQVRIPPGTPPGPYFIGAILDVKNAFPEYSEVNNMNPQMAGDHGNAAVKIH